PLQVEVPGSGDGDVMHIDGEEVGSIVEIQACRLDGSVAPWRVLSGSGSVLVSGYNMDQNGTLKTEHDLVVSGVASVEGDTQINGDVSIAGRMTASDGLAVGNAEAAVVPLPTSVVKKVPMHDDSGQWLGYIYLYDQQ
ncbi:MAG: hypothetical protein JXD18_15100, partial [Anaerolineae bacterium]|nr:hypothetical protein [Anaerolineae bacterium]